MSEANINLYVLDQGFVKYVGHFGDDALVAQSARVSYADGTKKVRSDEQLIDYLVRHQHFSPLEIPSLTLHIKAPLFVIAQMDRHRTQRKNQVSGRYSVLKDEFHTPETFRAQSESNKQMSGENLPNTMQNKLQEEVQDLYDVAYTRYQKLLDEGVSREQARMVLPQSMYSEMYWQMDLRNLLFGFLKQRLDSHAQPEIQEYARAIAYIVQQFFPVCYAAFEEHSLMAQQLSNTELYMLKEVLRGIPEASEYFKNIAAELGFRKTKLNEFYNKLDIKPVKE